MLQTLLDVKDEIDSNLDEIRYNFNYESLIKEEPNEAELIEEKVGTEATYSNAIKKELIPNKIRSVWDDDDSEEYEEEMEKEVPSQKISSVPVIKTWSIKENKETLSWHIPSVWDDDESEEIREKMGIHPPRISCVWDEDVPQDNLLWTTNNSVIVDLTLPLKECAFCHKHFEMTYLKTHIFSVHSDLLKKYSFMCKTCKNNFIHQEENFTLCEKCLAKNNKIFQCDVCGKQFKQKYNITRHLKMHGENISLKPLATLKNFFECFICHEKIFSSVKFRNHIRKHTRPFSCHLCNKSFIDKKYFNVHIARHSAGAFNKGPFVCEICSKSYILERRHTKHMLVKHNVKPKQSGSDEEMYICDLCSKVFYERIAMINHWRCHSGNTCPICNNAFSSSFDLDMHFKTHNCGLPFCCEICKKGFAKRRSLMYHMRIHRSHLNKGSFYCKLCNKGFGKITYLKRHSTLHTNQNGWL